MIVLPELPWTTSRAPPPSPDQGQRAAELVDLGIDLRLDFLEPPLLRGVVRNERAQARERGVEAGERGIVGLEVVRVAGQEIAALPRLGVGAKGEQRVELADDLSAVRNAAPVRGEALGVRRGQEAAGEKPDEQHRKPGDDEGVSRGSSHRIHARIDARRPALPILS